MNKHDLIRELNQIITEDYIPNYRGVKIEKFVPWPINIEFNEQEHNFQNLIHRKTPQQIELPLYDYSLGNFEFLECSKDNTAKIQSFEYCLDLYERHNDN